MANYWNKNSGDTLLTLEEQVTIAPFQLPLSESNATVQIISGELPGGLYLDGTSLRGTPREVSKETTSTFVIRATYNNQISDRTFKIVVLGADDPQWQTPAGQLAIGNNNTYFILDSAPIDFQLQVIDTDTEAGQVLEYFIGSRGGTLPPGIKLTPDGRLVGIVDPVRAIELATATGKYDEVGFDQDAKAGFDWSVPDNNGFDSFYYDITTYDLSTPTRSPKKLNRYYEFTVSVSDGDSIAERTFTIYVVGDDFLRSDNTIMQVGTGTFQADITHIRVPIWITPSDFGYRRANNYVTLILDIIDPNTLSGVVSYYLKTTNDDDTPSILPPGLELDATTGEIAGRVPYQPAVTKEYNFTIAAQRIGYDVDRVQLLKFAKEETNQGLSQLKINKLDTQYLEYVPGREFTYLGRTYEVLNVLSTISSEFDVLNLTTPLLDTIPKATSINLGTITLSGQEVATSKKKFSIKLLGEIDSTIKWNTLADFGDFSANYISTLSVSATTSVPNGTLLYTIKSGQLPPGLTLSLDGEIIGKVNSFGQVGNPGLTIFDSGNLKLDQNETRFDRTYKFTITAQDQFGFSAIDREFTITLADPDNKLYSNLYMAPMMTPEKRRSYADIINNSSIFTPETLYRPNDPNFGLQSTIKMLLYPGIEAKHIREFVGSLSQNAKRKRYHLGKIKTAVAKTPGTQRVIYEIVYLEVIDPQVSQKPIKTKKKIKIANKDKILINSTKYTTTDDLYDNDLYKLSIGTREETTDLVYKFGDDLKVKKRDSVFIKSQNITTNDIPIRVAPDFDVLSRSSYPLAVPFTPGVLVSRKLRPDPENTVTVDLEAITVDGSQDTTRYNSATDHMKDNIRAIGETEKNFMPLWMRSSQVNQIAELGMINAIPLCYCKPGTSATVANKLNLENIDFSVFDFDIDRVLIDSSEGVADEQYIVFANYEYNV
jgi:hypothetical protein